jgi:hypothetical protein
MNRVERREEHCGGHAEGVTAPIVRIEARDESRLRRTSVRGGGGETQSCGARRAVSRGDARFSNGLLSLPDGRGQSRVESIGDPPPSS